MDTDATRPTLSAEEVRILGCLIEKSRTTPDDYPLTANALMRAANQSTSRDPVVDYDQRTVDATAVGLKASGFVRFVHTPSGRATTRYRHVVDERLGLDDAQCAVLGLLMLRGAQTVAELKTRSERWHPFAGPEAIVSTLESLAARPDPLVLLLERQPGQKEVRWTHLLQGEPILPAASTGAGSPGSSSGGTAERIRELEQRVADLEARLSEVRSELGLD
ncbi:MAG: YceH family protein [Acidimicrobiales bacterium]